MRAIILALGAALALSPIAAIAAPAASKVTADARCLVTMGAFAGASDPSLAQTARVGVVYFAGRVKAEDPTFDFGARLKPIAAGMTPETLQAEAQQRCGPMLMETMRQLDAAQKALGPPASAAKPPTLAKPPAAALTPAPKP